MERESYYNNLDRVVEVAIRRLQSIPRDPKDIGVAAMLEVLTK